jgi:pimeloyl-ACP methyl ester carboxylesterase
VRRLLTLGTALAVALAAAPPAVAADWRPCPDTDVAECARVSVPLDRSGTVPGEIGLHVERIPALSGRHTGAVFALAGGPGQAATPLTEGFGFLLDPALESRDLVVFDQRGTGRSGALRCPAFEQEAEVEPLQPEPQGPTNTVARCAEQLGPKRAFFTSRDSAEDIEAVRRELGVERIALYGTSYGTKVALTYAERYPEHVERMVLDSVVEPAGPDALSREVLEAVPRVLRDLCRTDCRRVTPDPADDVAQLALRLAATPQRGYRVGADGRRRPAELRREDVLAFLVAADFFPQARTLLPGAVRGALAGDNAPLLRLTGATEAQAELPETPEEFSEALYVATICEEVSFPYDRDASPEERVEEARRAAEKTPDEAFFPFDRETALRLGLVELCASWPSSGREPEESETEGAITDAPTLLLSGEEDLRTPLEGARRTAERLPNAALVSVPSVGHSVLGDVMELCAGRTLERFFTDEAVSGRCPDEFPLGPVLPKAPLSLAEVDPPPGIGGRPGRTLTATALTLDDTLLASLFTAAPSADPTTIAGGGLRSGRFRLEVGGGASEDSFEGPLKIVLSLDRVGYVPGVRVSGELALDPDLHFTGRVTVSGGAAAPARLAVRSTRRGYRLEGDVDGRDVHANVPTVVPPG